MAAAVPEATVMLNIWANGSPTPYHVTIAHVALLNTTATSLQAHLVKNFGFHFGRQNVYAVKYSAPWGQNSILIDFMSSDIHSLDGVRHFMFQNLTTLQEIRIVTTRYPQFVGFPPQHVNTNGSPFPYPTGLTFVISVK